MHLICKKCVYQPMDNKTTHLDGTKTRTGKLHTLTFHILDKHQINADPKGSWYRLV